MLKKIAFFTALTAVVSSAHAIITSYGQPAQYGISASPENWYEINPYTWEVFTTYDSDRYFSDGKPSYTSFSAEMWSSGVLDGKMVSQATAFAVLTDRRALFGGDGYVDLGWWQPTESKYAQQFVFLGGWKYNITKYFDLDLGGNVIYSTKKVVGPGLVGMGGELWRGDVYVGIVTDKIFLRPFIYFHYDPTYDSKKYQAGFSPVIDLEPYTAIEGLALESQVTFAYVDANRWSGNQKIDGKYWSNAYAYIQLESHLAYTYNKSFKVYVGVGWTINNDGRGKVGQGGFDMGPDNMVWGGGGIGYIF